MQDLLLAWAALVMALVIFAIGRPGRGGALTLAYFLGLSLIHVPGVLPFLGSGSGLPGVDETQIGFEATILGMAAFVVGAVLARWVGQRLCQRACDSNEQDIWIALKCSCRPPTCHCSVNPCRARLNLASAIRDRPTLASS